MSDILDRCLEQQSSASLRHQLTEGGQQRAALGKESKLIDAESSTTEHLSMSRILRIKGSAPALVLLSAVKAGRHQAELQHRQTAAEIRFDRIATLNPARRSALWWRPPLHLE